MATRDPLVRPFLAALLACTCLAFIVGPARAAGGVGDLFVTSDASNIVRAYTGATGAYIGVHLASVAPPNGELAIHFGARIRRGAQPQYRPWQLPRPRDR